MCKIFSVTRGVVDRTQFCWKDCIPIVPTPPTEHAADAKSSAHLPNQRASMGSHIELMEYLLANGSSLNEVDNRGNDCMLLACLAGSIKCVSYQLEHLTQQPHANLYGITPLMMAAGYGTRIRHR